MKNIFQRGFTLIELLVVIAIIGILAAVVIGSLNDARSGGQDASVQQSVANIRSQAELIYNSDNYSYGDVCADPAVENLMDAALNVVNGTDYAPSTHGIPAYVPTNNLTGDATTRTGSCHDDNTTYVAQAPLASEASFWCVDSTGASRKTDAMAASDTQCPPAN